MEIRKLKTRDIFKLSKIVKKIGLGEVIKNKKDQFKQDQKNISEEQKNIQNENFGIELIMYVVENIYLAENELIELIAELGNCKIEEVEELSIKEIKDIVIKIVKTEDFKSFLA